MTTISIEEIQDDLQSFLHKLEAGEPLVVTRAGETIAEVRPLALQASQPRPFGLCAGEFAVPDDFDAPLPDETHAQFQG
jgi:antitoxin (DNA-binding transcriptional repressor) of toxin-antitoxin stability system